MRLLTWLSFLFVTLPFQSFSQQSVTGIWRGYFIADNGYQYRLEFQVKQNASYAVSGVSYSWQDDIRFYGKATMTGNFIDNSQNFRIREIKTVEVKTMGGGTCIMNYDLRYSRSGKEEFLEGTYLGKQEVKDGPNPYEWGDCGGGRVFLRKVTTSDFYIEPSLRPTPKKLEPKKNTAPPVVKEKPLTPPPVTRKTTIPKSKPPAGKKPNTGTTENKVKEPPVAVNADSITKGKPEITKVPAKTPVITPSILKTRENKLAQTLVITDPDVTVKLYDNGEIDDDTISVFLNKKLVLSHKRLTASPLILKFKMDDDNSEQELTMVAENLGSIPPNTSVMMVESGDQSFRVSITSTEQKNAVVKFTYQKPK
ncbi:MAG TPA: hypothetical protein VFD56_03945 [Chitinophagaceae bacterium]|nr:hypothetical protein [Chitinophagaceae bacterium]